MVLRVRTLSWPYALQSHDAELHQQILRLRCISHKPGDRASPADFTAAVTPALVVPCALDQEGPAPLEDSARSVLCDSTVLVTSAPLFVVAVITSAVFPRCTPPVAWCTDDGVEPPVRTELLSAAGSCWLPTTTPLCHITWDARRPSALHSYCTSADSARRPSRCRGASYSSEWPNRHAPTQCHRHIGPFQYGTQAGIDSERDLLRTKV